MTPFWDETSPRRYPPPTTGPTIRFTRDGQRAVIRLKDAKPRLPE